MQLLDEIIALAIDGNGKTPVLLRKCLLLALQLKNDRLSYWAERELDGYSEKDDPPEYRRTTGMAKGYFLGPFGASISDQPLPASVLKEEHRHWARDIQLRQPIVAYEDSGDTGTAVFMWPADMVAAYQAKFIHGYALNRAWLEIPGTTFQLCWIPLATESYDLPSI
jgi:hypothetical protein